MNRWISCTDPLISQRHLHQESRRGLPPWIARCNQQALKHLGLAHCAARRQQQRGPEEFDDLLQESRVGLIRGLERFDQQRGLRPSSYLLSRATGQILHYRRDRSRTIRIPWRLRDLYAAGMKSSGNANRTGNRFSAIRTLQPNYRFDQSAGLPPLRAMEPARSSTCLPALGSQQARVRRMNTWTG